MSSSFFSRVVFPFPWCFLLLLTIASSLFRSRVDSFFFRELFSCSTRRSCCSIHRISSFSALRYKLPFALLLIPIPPPLGVWTTSCKDENKSLAWGIDVGAVLGEAEKDPFVVPDTRTGVVIKKATKIVAKIFIEIRFLRQVEYAGGMSEWPMLDSTIFVALRISKSSGWVCSVSLQNYSCLPEYTYQDQKGVEVQRSQKIKWCMIKFIRGEMSGFVLEMIRWVRLIIPKSLPPPWVVRFCRYQIIINGSSNFDWYRTCLLREWPLLFPSWEWGFDLSAKGFQKPS